VNGSDTIAITLPHGFWESGTHYRNVEIRALTGDDESFFLEVGLAMLPVTRATAVLARCITRLGPIAHATLEAVRTLTVGDREALLLQLRRMTLGERIRGMLDCPAPGCGERMDIEIDAGQLLLPPYADVKEVYEADIEVNGTVYSVGFRLPTGADQEAVAAEAVDNAEVAALRMLRRCVEHVKRADGQPVDDFPLGMAARLSALMADLDPQAELILNLNCSKCGHAFSPLLDATVYLFRELAEFSKQLYQEVHLLAFYHHWRESDILAMTPVRRHRYLECLAETLESGRSR
jgi:hypothetical protein